jgi:hypothetical protein
MTDDYIYYQGFMSALKDKISHKATLVNFITDILAIDKDAVYRRLRGEVNFSFTEMAIISKKIGISLDRITGFENKQTRPAQINFSNQVNPTPIDYEMFEGHVDLLKACKDDPDAQIIEVTNIFPHYLFQDYEHITRYCLFRWNYAGMNGDVVPYSKIIIPERLRALQKETCEYARHISSTLYVWDSSLFQRAATNLKYFVKIRLINEEDIALIKNDMVMLLDNLEKIAIKGRHEDTGKEVSIYLSDVTTDANYSCLKTKDIHLTLIRAFILNATVSFDVEVFNYACAWIQSMQRMSTLISVSGEKARAIYFDSQRKLIDTL